VEDTLFVNPGSVGLRSEYAVIDTESDPWDVAFRTVTYDRKDLDRRIEQLDWPAPVA
jgi:Icc-related predicted phosphoesterase